MNTHANIKVYYEYTCQHKDYMLIYENNVITISERQSEENLP